MYVCIADIVELCLTISLLLDGLHPTLMYTLPENLQWYDTIFDALKDYYKDRIIDEYEYIE